MPQKKRTSKKSAGERRSSKPVKLTRVQKFLLGKGPLVNYKPLTKDEIDAYLASK